MGHALGAENERARACLDRLAAHLEGDLAFEHVEGLVLVSVGVEGHLARVRVHLGEGVRAVRFLGGRLEECRLSHPQEPLALRVTETVAALRVDPCHQLSFLVTRQLTASATARAARRVEIPRRWNARYVE